MNRFRHMPQMVQVMTPFPWHIDIEAPLSDAEQVMKAHHIRHLAVTRNGEFESILSERDLLRAVAPGRQYDLTRELQVGDVCPPRAYCADVGDPLDQVLLAMAETHIGAVIVLREGALAGIFTESDAFRVLAARLQEQYAEAPPPDAA